MIQNVTILGAGSAGLTAALTLKNRLPALRIGVLCSREIGTIGVGEGTTQQFPRFFFNVLGLPVPEFYREVQPTWKLGLRLLWGPRETFHYTFSNALDARLPELPRNHGFYCREEIPATDVWSACIQAGRALPRTTEGVPWFNEHINLAFHMENARLVTYLEARCRERGIEFSEAAVAGVERNGKGIGALVLESGEKITADLFVDASGFRSELLGRSMEEPFCDFSGALFCDRAVIGGWPREEEPILPCTTCETMNAGWCWQIEHERFINRGYVYSSRFISDDAARSEFLRKNPKVPPEKTRVVKFRSGHHRRAWAGNVVAIGNACGFVEPLEATALATINLTAGTLADILDDTRCDPPETAKDLLNRFVGDTWRDVRDFLALHYRFNTRLDTPFWRHCWNETPLGDAQPIVDFYRENGPSALAKTILIGPNNVFGWEGYLAMLVGQKVPYARPHEPSAQELEKWNAHVAQMRMVGERAFTVREVLDLLRSQPGWA